MSNLAKAVEAVKEQHKPVHRQYVTFYNQTVHISIKCQTKKTARMLCDAWAYAIRLYYDDKFMIHCNYMQDNEILSTIREYPKPHKAEEKEIIGGRGHG